jgi:hypothetical protein
MVLDYRLNCNRLLPGQRGDQQLLPPPEPVAHRSPPTPGLQVRQDRTRTRSLGRRIHDPRHAAACLWLTVEVHVVIVQAWMGHASIATTNLYMHHLGTSADATLGHDAADALHGVGNQVAVGAAVSCAGSLNRLTALLEPLGPATTARSAAAWPPKTAKAVLSRLRRPRKLLRHRCASRGHDECAE